MLDRKLLKHIIKSYSPIEDILSAQEVKEGYLSQNYILKTNQEKYFFKQYRDKYTEEGIKDINRVSNFFSQNNIPVILPLPTTENKGYFIFNHRIYSVFPFVNGVKIDRKNIDNKSIKSLAKTLANIHLLSLNGLPIQIRACNGVTDTTAFLKDSPKILKILNSINEKSPFDKLALELLSLKHSIVKNNVEKIKALHVKTDHLLHGDYHEKNVFLDTKGDVKHIFDLEKTELGDRLHEVIRSMDFICLNEGYDDGGVEKARIYLQTYNKIYPIKKRDFLHALERYYFIKANSLWIERTNYLEGSNRVDCFLQNQLDSLRFFPENFDVLMKLLEI
jgi:Ser/Thr protein kinase RdoA (MazF antagonist)